MTDAVDTADAAASAPAGPPEARACANCSTTLTGPFCSQCGQESRNLQRPFSRLASEFLDDVFSLDTRFVRTLRPLLFTPGLVTREYLAGRRATYVPPLRAYLVSALIFFGLFSLFPNQSRVEVFVGEARATSERGEERQGARVAFDLPARMPLVNDWYQRAAARAKADPDGFAIAVGTNVPRVFFLFLPIFAALLELLYRREGYYLDHLVFALYFHSVGFLVASCIFLVGKTGVWLPVWITGPTSAGLLIGLIAYLPIALRRVYGGSRGMTALKLLGLAVLYWATYGAIGVPLLLFAGLVSI